MKIGYVYTGSTVTKSTDKGKSPSDDSLLRALEESPAVEEMFSKIATSPAFSRKAAHKAFAGIKRK